MVYLAIGIAARSDEHLRLLQLLTRALGETDLAEALRRASSAEALLKLLQGAPQALALDAQLVGLNVLGRRLRRTGLARCPPAATCRLCRQWLCRRAAAGRAAAAG